MISLSKIRYSIHTAQQMIEPLNRMGFDAELFEGIYGDEALILSEQEGRTLYPFDHNENPLRDTVKVSGPGARGCFYSHYRLWQKCVDLNEPIFIFEDDIVFLRNYIPVNFDEILIVVPGSWKTIYKTEPRHEPTIRPQALDYTGVCLPGAPGYGITPKAAKKLVDKYKNYYLPADSAIRKTVVDIKIHSHLIGEVIINKISLTNSNRYWSIARNVEYNKDEW